LDLFILNPRGHPILTTDHIQWSRDQEADPRWHIATDRWEAELGWVIVDTKFLGFDPRMEEERTGAPVLFDSVAFFYPRDEEVEPERVAQQLYRSRAAATKGHEQLVQLLTGNLSEGRENGKLKSEKRSGT